MSAIANTAQSGPLRRVASTMRPQRGRLVLASLLGAMATLCAIGLLGVSGWLISRASQMPPVLTLTVAIVGVRAFGVGRGFFRYAERLVAHDAVLRGLTDLRVAVWNRLNTLSPQGLGGFRRGDLLARFVADVDAAQDLALRVMLPAVTAVVAGSVSVAVTWWLLPAAGLALLVALLAGATLVPLATLLTGAYAQRTLSPAQGELSAHVRDLLIGAPDLLATGSASRALRRTLDADAELVRLGRRSALGAGVDAALGVAIAGAAVIASLLAAVIAVGDGRLDGVNLAVVVLLPLAAYESVATLPAAAVALTRVRGSARRVTEILDAAPSIVEPSQPLPLDPGRPHTGLRLRGFTVTWGSNAHPSVHGVDLDLPPGARIAVVGPSGAGKSTLAAALVRFVDYQGSATLDGQELRDLGGDVARRLIGLCEQDVHVFDSTLEENLRVANTEASMSELQEALATVQLDDWVATLPAGLDTRVGEHGSQLSGGQRQRLGVARALLPQRPVLVLDEPTEHLDVEAATALTHELLTQIEGRAIILITHRLIGLEAMDEILVLHDGVVVQRGRHADLVRGDGRYRREWLRQREHQDALALADSSRTTQPVRSTEGSVSR